MRKTIYTIIAGLAVLRFIVLRWVYPVLSPIEQFYAFVFGILFMIILLEWTYFLHRKLNRYFPFEKGIAFRLLLQIGLSVFSVLLLEAGLIFYVLPVVLPSIDREVYTTPLAFLQVVIMIFGINMGFFGVYFFNAWKQKLIESERLAKENALMQKNFTLVKLANLQNQLNPHFLFNSIASLQGLIFENQALASQFLEHLAQVYRYVLQHKDKELVSLQSEDEFTENYIFLLKIRFGEALQIEKNIDSESKEKRIVPVTLQMLIENAVKHNVMSQERPLKIEVCCEADYLCVSNDWQPKKIAEYSNKVGLQNIQTIYEYLSEKALTFEQKEGKFVVKVPLIH